MSKTIFPLLCCALFFSCAKPTDPESLYVTGGYTVVGRLSISGYAEDVKMQDTIAYMAQGEGGLSIVSVADPTRPRLLSLCQQGVRGYAYKLARKDSIVYLAAGGFGLNTINVGDPYHPAFVQQFGSASTTYNVEVFGDWVLEAKGEWGLRFDNLFQVGPGFVDARGRIQGPGYAHGIAVTADSSMFLTSGEMGVALYDLRDIGWYGGEGGGWYDERKEYSSWVDLPGYAVDVTTMGTRPIAFVACGTGGVFVVDFSNRDTLKVVGSYATGGYAKEVAYQNNRLYVTTELRGLQILSVADPTAPQLVGAIHSSYALGVAVDQHFVYVTDETEGLIIVAIPPY